MSEIRGEYWIINGSVEFADGDSGDKNHEMIAYEHLANSYVDVIYNYAKSIGVKVPSLSSIEYSENVGESVHDLLGDIQKTLFSEKDPKNPNLPLFKNNYAIFEKIKEETHIEEEALKILVQGVYFGASLDPRVYVMKKDGWVVLRNNNVELYGYNDSKRKEIINGVEQVLDEEGVEAGDEEIELNIFDHKTKRSWDSNLSDLKSGGIRAVTLPNTTYNRPILVPADRSKISSKPMDIRTRNMLQTSESNLNFREWLIRREWPLVSNEEPPKRRFSRKDLLKKNR
jgi:hypothetical protein